MLGYTYLYLHAAHPVSNIGQFHENYTATTGTE